MKLHDLIHITFYVKYVHIKLGFAFYNGTHFTLTEIPQTLFQPLLQQIQKSKLGCQMYILAHLMEYEFGSVLP